MSINRFLASSSREALKNVRALLGDDAVILSNRKVTGGVEVIATGQQLIASMINPQVDRGQKARLGASTPTSTPTSNNLSMPATQHDVRKTAAAPRIFPPNSFSTSPNLKQYLSRNAATPAEPATKEPQVKESLKVLTVPAESGGSHLLQEVQSMKALLQQQIGALSWMNITQRRPMQAKLMVQMLGAGFSPALSRALTDRMPPDNGEVSGAKWLRESITRNLQTPQAGRDFVETGGIIALVGPTGVGKTTTAAKLAARCVVKFGASSLGLITVDSYRIGAQDQLRIYGKILGVPVHSARDKQSLNDILSSMHDKHLILIDTVGLSQKDERVPEQMQLLSAPGIERVLLLNAAAQGETLEDVVRANRDSRLRKTIITKLDEAVKFGCALDCVIRHKMELQFVTNGQRVPEDIHPAHAGYLVDRALKVKLESPFALDAEDLALSFFPQSSNMNEGVATHV